MIYAIVLLFVMVGWLAYAVNRLETKLRTDNADNLKYAKNLVAIHQSEYHQRKYENLSFDPADLKVTHGYLDEHVHKPFGALLDLLGYCWVQDTKKVFPAHLEKVKKERKKP